MKKIYAAILVLMALSGLCRLSAQCPTGDVTLTTQHEVNGFLATWPECDTIHGNLFIGKEDGNSTISSLLALTKIRHIKGSLHIVGNASLLYIGPSGITNVRTIDGDFVIARNPRLSTMGVWQNLKVIGGSLRIADNDDLNQTGVLNALDTVRGDVQLIENDRFKDTLGLNSLRYIGGSLNIEQNHALRHLEGFYQLSHVGQDVYISQNIPLADLKGLGNLRRIEGKFMMMHTPALSNLQGLTSLEYIGELVLRENIGLRSLKGLDAAHIQHAIRLDGNFSLTRLFENNLLESFRGDLYIGVSALPDLSDLTAVDSLRSLQLVGNIRLKSLNGLENLVVLDSSLVLRDHPLLDDLTALDHPVSFGGRELIIAENDSLSACAEQAICDWLVGPDIEHVEIAGNRPGCESRAAIEQVCADQQLSELELKVWPNPFRNQLDLLVSTSYHEAAVRIWDAAGRLLLQDRFTRSRQLDLSVLSPGLYFMEIRSAEQVLVRRIVKI